MSREIKFRAWDMTDALMRDGIDYRGIDKEGIAQFFELGKDIFVSFREDRLMLMQYTGLHDKNGTEIFEGDILDDGGVIEFRDDLNFDSGGAEHSGFFSTKGYEYKDSGSLDYHYQISEREVIGNIYENPDLLAGHKEGKG